MKKGLLIIYSGPSGVGKGTVRSKLFEYPELNLEYSISMTTRSIRPGEIDGKDYFFVSQERFDEAIRNDELLEHASFVNHSYGTPKSYVEKLRNEGKNVVLEIEVNGSMQVMEKCKDAISIFILPPSLEELENRIRHRGTEEEKSIQGRLEKARIEVGYASKYTKAFINDDVDKCAKEIRDFLYELINK